jgi:dTDP-4-dehydrorhamnose 3,5-epimerase
MRFTETPIEGAMVIDIEEIGDDRGYFARTYCASEFSEHGLGTMVAQANMSYNRHRGTLRGMHYQVHPAKETKLVRCPRGAIYDVIVDMRPDSSSYLTHFGVELTADNHRALYVPEMCAHGFQTLVDDTEVSYQVGAFYTPASERGARFDDPAFGIEWPLPVSVISEKDRSWPTLRVEAGARG